MLRIREYIYFPAEDGKKINRRRVNLKELEKFGFIEDKYVEDKCYARRFCIGTEYNEEIIIWENDREIQIVNGISLLNILYDLITAGYVEKVEEENK